MSIIPDKHWGTNEHSCANPRTCSGGSGEES